MKPTFIALLALCLCLPLAGADKKKQAGFKGIKPVRSSKLARSSNLLFQAVKPVRSRELARSSNPSELDPTKPLPKDFKSLKALAVRGDARAQNELGIRYEYGKEVLEDDKEAVKWYRKAAAQGHAPAQVNLGLMYAIGEGVPQDFVTAYAWWDIAAANGNTDTVAVTDLLAKETAATGKTHIAKEMTPEQITKAEALVKEMVKKNPKLLKK